MLLLYGHADGGAVQAAVGEDLVDVGLEIPGRDRTRRCGPDSGLSRDGDARGGDHPSGEQ
jgi:hypothetical protein